MARGVITALAQKIAVVVKICSQVYIIGEESM